MHTSELFPTETLNQKLGYDLKEDLMCFMHNDPDFYRKEYYPAVHKFKQYIESGKKVQSRAFESLVRKAYRKYENRFQVEGLAGELPDDMCQELCQEIHQRETKHIEDGHYDE